LGEKTEVKKIRFRVGRGGETGKIARRRKKRGKNKVKRDREKPLGKKPKRRQGEKGADSEKGLKGPLLSPEGGPNTAGWLKEKTGRPPFGH